MENLMKTLRFALLALTTCAIAPAFAQEPLNTAGMQAIDEQRRAEMLRAVPPAVTPESYRQATSVLTRNNSCVRRDCTHRDCAPRPSRGGVTVIINNGAGGYYGPVYPGYPAYPTYGYPAYPYGYGQAYSGSSVTVSTPGFSNGTFTVFPWSSTVTTFNSAPAYAPRFPAYPTYVPNVNGYRGAATPNYNYNNGAILGGGYTGAYVGNYRR
jgi:hypothetical protein